MFQYALVHLQSEGLALKSVAKNPSVYIERESNTERVTYSGFLLCLQLRQLRDTLCHSCTLLLCKSDRALVVLYFNTQVVFQRLQIVQFLPERKT